MICEAVCCFAGTASSLLREITLLAKNLYYWAPFVGFCHFLCKFVVVNISRKELGKVQFLHRFVRITSSVRWYARTVGFLHRFVRTAKSLRWCAGPVGSLRGETDG
jgi:hypothetical protein